jgi:endonuclease YncB( thermonuclease family)
VPGDARRDGTASDRAALRARIAEAVAQAGAYPVAERTLALLAEAALVPGPESPGYRVVDRAGVPRRITGADGTAVPMDLPALLAELRDQHPALFRPIPEPAPEPEPEPVPTEDFRTATARFVGAQSVLARSLVARSATRGRALATSVSDRLATLRRSRAEGSTAEPSAPGLATEAPEPSRAGLVAGRVRDGAQRVGGYARGRLADSASRFGEVARDRNVLRDALSRRALPIGLGAAALVALIAVLGGRTPPETAPAETGSPPSPQSQPQSQPSASATAAPPPSAPDMSPAAPEEAPPKQAAANEISGPVEVIDTATLRVSGKLVRLFGVEWVRGGQADELTRYLAGRTVTCQPVAGSEARLCSVEGRDLSEVVLFNGGGRASPEATPDLVAAEDHARAERLGVWAR